LLKGCESEFRDMNQFSGIGIVSLEFKVSPEVGVIAREERILSAIFGRKIM
jgi:hypothetical protein